MKQLSTYWIICCMSNSSPRPALNPSFTEEKPPLVKTHCGCPLASVARFLKIDPGTHFWANPTQSLALSVIPKVEVGFSAQAGSDCDMKAHLEQKKERRQSTQYTAVINRNKQRASKQEKNKAKQGITSHQSHL